MAPGLVRLDAEETRNRTGLLLLCNGVGAIGALIAAFCMAIAILMPAAGASQ